MSVNEVPGTLRNQNWLKVKGPWVTGQATLQQYEQTFLHYQCKVTRGFYIDPATVPFGFFVIVQPGNAAESVLNVYEVPTETEGGSKVFNIRTTEVNKYDEWLCRATITRQVVAAGTSPDSGATVWESKVEPIDEVHALKTTVYATEVFVKNDHEWDEQLNQYVSREITPQSSGGSASVQLAGSTVTHTHYKELKCGWYLKFVETFSRVNRSYQTTVDFYWPAVLTEFEDMVYNRKDLPNGSPGGANYYTFPDFSKEAYRGPTKALIEELWTTAPQTIADPQIMLPLPVSIVSPFVSVSVGPSLHVAFDYVISINDDPEFEDVVATYSFGATTPTDWPSSLVASHEQVPSRGGYLSRKVTVYPPEY